MMKRSLNFDGTDLQRRRESPQHVTRLIFRPTHPFPSIALSFQSSTLAPLIEQAMRKSMAVFHRHPRIGCAQT